MVQGVRGFNLNKILQADFDLIAKANIPLLELRDKNILITGASGFLSSYLIKLLVYLEITQNLNLSIVALVKDLDKAKRVYSELGEQRCLTFLNQKVESEIPPNYKFDYIIHAASYASPSYYKSNPVDVLKANTVGTVNLLDFAVKHPPKSFLFFSSGEVYGQSDDSLEVDEDSYGYLNPLDARSCYAESKRLGETACVSYFRQYGVSTKIVRPFHTYGPGMNLSDGRVFSDFVSNIVKSENIILKSDGLAMRPYCYVGDATLGFLTVLLTGACGEAYNVGNPEQEVSVLELANRLVSLFPEKGLRVVTQERLFGDNYLPSKINRNCPNISKIGKLGWKPVHSIESGFKRTIESYNEQ